MRVMLIRVFPGGGQVKEGMGDQVSNTQAHIISKDAALEGGERKETREKITSPSNPRNPIVHSNRN
jgi:hypothetical protein